ncbi:AUX/IAA protein [Corchorus capsularis]|uniref:Auxin response factor n=1 Tax=Corchorus capsularis TaxID=210143 RepID=A0A1R3I5Q3_COCAP|nr:AUX/IAA protein [Corchorus capsularis]
MDGQRNHSKTYKVSFSSRKRSVDVDGLRRPPNNPGEKDDMYIKLWHACAGPSVYVPRVGEKVLYFPQGHMEQVDAYVNQEGTMEMPIYNLPSKILCRVVHVHLNAEPGTDEVFAQIALIPEAEQDVLSEQHRNYEALPRKGYSRFFSKKLTPSDTNTHGSFSIPKKHADDGCLPPLNMSQQTPQQELVATDLHGFQWHFRHIYRGQPRRHLLTSGWSTFVSSKKIVAGDSFIFLRGGNGELKVGIRRATTLPSNTATSVISGVSMRHGILTSAFHAFSTRSMLTVYYHPWTTSSEFIIPLDQYIKSMEIDYSTGTRFRMKLEGDEPGEQRALGTIISNEDVDRIRWPNSEWRSLKVEWDRAQAATDAILRQERVCPWNIEPIGFTNKKKIPYDPRHQKRTRIDGVSSPGFSSLLMNAASLGLQNNWPPTFSNNALARRTFSFPNVNSQAWMTLESRNENETSISDPNSRNKCIIFGVSLANGSPELPSPQVLTSSEHESLIGSIPPTSQSSVSEPSEIKSSKHCTSCHSLSNRSCTKVLKHGSALGRSVDLNRFDGYESLISELDHMFEFKGKLTDGSSGWRITFTDDDGDLLLVGDYPWELMKIKANATL